ncbi:MAG: hypothetical protein OEM04_07665 [Flavobacteriaceae bacterium]|nr:hypothetical protein [Flavobacteriaceae bacterium]
MFGNLFKPRAHYVFNYKPRYYDERKERLESLKKKYENKEGDSDDIPKLKLSKDQLKSDWQRHKKVATDKGVNRRLAIIIAIIIGILAYIFELHKLF